MKTVELNGTCSAGGALTVEATEDVIGYLEKIEYDYIDGDTGADFTITSTEAIAVPILTVTNAGVADVVYYPRAPVVNASNAAVTNSFSKHFIVGKPKIVVAQGGNAKQFKWVFYLSDE